MSGDESEVELTISAEEFSRWIKPKRALEILRESMSHSAALNALVRYLMGRMLRARADTVVLHYNGERKTYPRGPIPSDAWDDDKPSYSSPFWENGLLDWSEGFGESEREFSAFDVRFDPVVIYQLAGRESPPVSPEQAPAAEMTGFLGPRLQDKARATRPTPPQAEPPPPMPRRRIGRPAKEYWEPMLVEIMRQIWVGDLKPRRQADVQHAMAEWIVTNGYDEPAPTQLKIRARLVFQVYEKEQE